MPSIQSRKTPSPRSKKCFRKIISPCKIPSEVIDEIVAAILADKRAFSSIMNFSLASYQFRQIAFRRFFGRLYARSSGHWTNCCKIPGMFSWVRKLECYSSTLTGHCFYLRYFQNLQALEIDFFKDGLSTQSDRVKSILRHVTSGLTRLTFTFLPRIDTPLLDIVASTLPDLETLELSCVGRLDEDCCWGCYEDSASCTIHSPLPDIYSNVDELVEAYGSALQPLQKLEHLHLGIFLSGLDAFDQHLLHAELEHRLLQFVMEHDHARDFELPFGLDFCHKCAEEHACEVRTRELYAGAAMATYLESLKTITWSSYFAEKQPGDNIHERSTTMWIQRSEEKVRVRRAPW
ncbi:hypothetical protein OBBRIDRAFT_809230 [Obba rivulosa]|uniref:Uncharacterized protein n=1 Tax=Obba rivulosa TaxID=1052685 RepID=A0A8E2DVB1_9APHY|nr:hypothetical protein OBBRIDRAFT_809230 [Obba rivulosa]